METHENIKALREMRGLSQEALAERVGYKDRSMIAHIEAGRVDLSQSKIAAFAKALSVSPAFLMGITDEAPLPDNIIPMPRMNSVPLIGSIACGVPILAEENIEEYVDLPEHIKADFALRCKGDSMTGARINDGDIVYIHQQPEVQNGEIAAVVIEDKATLKRVYRNGGTVILQPENPAYSPRAFSGPELENIRIIGKAVAFTSTI